MAEKEYIEREALMDALYDHEFQTFCPLDEVSGVIDIIPTADVVEVDKFASKIAGHSYYHGDKILARLYCLKEGQEIEKSIEPADVVEVVHGEWKNARIGVCMCVQRVATKMTSLIVIAPTAAQKWTERAVRGNERNGLFF